MLSRDEIEVLQRHNQTIYDLHEYLRRARRFPHAEQASPIRAFFNENKKVIMGQCGRSFGKTEIILYIAWRFALTHPGSEVYIICPTRNQAKKIYWFRKRLQWYGPQKYVEDHRESELRVVFKNGSTICLDGCENYEALRGIKPSLVIYDEFQHHSSEFDEEVMQPNLASGTPLVVMGTPPKTDCYYVHFRETLLDYIKRGDKTRHYMELPTWCNPTQSKDWLANKKEELRRSGRLNVWYREYEGKMVFDTESAIFPMLSESEHVYSPAFIDNLIRKDKSKLHWFSVFDPGTCSCFAVLFGCINPYTSQIFLVDEIYEKTREGSTTKNIWERANMIKAKHFSRIDEWRNIYDEAEAWFASEVASNYGVGIEPTRKQFKKSQADDSRPGESMIRTLMSEPHRFFISSACPKMFWELQNYVIGADGRYPKKNDHLIDCLHYMVLAGDISLVEEADDGYEEEEGVELLNAQEYDPVDDIYPKEDNADLWN